MHGGGRPGTPGRPRSGARTWRRPAGSQCTPGRRAAAPPRPRRAAPATAQQRGGRPASDAGAGAERGWVAPAVALGPAGVGGRREGIAHIAFCDNKVLARAGFVEFLRTSIMVANGSRIKGLQAQVAAICVPNRSRSAPLRSSRSFARMVDAMGAGYGPQESYDDRSESSSRPRNW